LSDVQDSRKRWNYSYTVLLLCWCGWIAIYLCRSVLAPILPVLSEELSMTHAQGGLLETAYLIGYIIIKIPAGAIANRIGIKRTLIISMFGYAISSALNFLAAGFIHLLTLRFLIGLFQGVHLPLANTLLSERFGDRQGRAIGFHESGPNVGNSIAYPLTVAIASRWSWRWAFLLLSLPAFTLSGAVAFFLRNEERPEPVGRTEHQLGHPSNLRSFLLLLAPLALAHSVYNLCLRTLLTFAPSFLVEFRGMDLGAAGVIAMLMPAAGFLAKVSSGFIAESVGRRNAICGATFLSGVFISSLAYVPSDYLLYVNFVVLGFALYSFSPTIYASVTSCLPTQLKSMGLGAVTMTGNVVGALSTFLIGFLIDTRSYETALLTVSVTVVLATVFIFITMGSKHREIK
jgi:ACS family hexuronate transporter-like MFS transporter